MSRNVTHTLVLTVIAALFASPGVVRAQGGLLDGLQWLGRLPIDALLGRDRDDTDYGRSDTRVLYPNQTRYDLSARRGEGLYFRMRVAPGTRRLEIHTRRGRGDLDLFLSHAEMPDTTRYQYRSVRRGTNETIVVNRPEPGDWFLLVYGFTAFEGVRLQADFRDDGGRQDDDWGAVRITEPNRQTVWPIGTEQWITWQRGWGVRRVQLEYSLDGGRRWRRIGPRTIDARDGRYRLRIPDNPDFRTDEARFRLIDADTGRILDETREFRLVGDWPGPGPQPEPGPLPGPGWQGTEIDLDRVVRLEVGRREKIRLWFDPPRPGRYQLNFDNVRGELEGRVILVDRDGRERRVDRWTVRRRQAELPFTVGRDTAEVYIDMRSQDRDDARARLTLDRVGGGGHHGGRGERIRLNEQVRVRVDRNRDQWLVFNPPRAGRYQLVFSNTRGQIKGRAILFDRDGRDRALDEWTVRDPHAQWEFRVPRGTEQVRIRVESRYGRPAEVDMRIERVGRGERVRLELDRKVDLEIDNDDLVTLVFQPPTPGDYRIRFVRVRGQLKGQLRSRQGNRDERKIDDWSVRRDGATINFETNRRTRYVKLTVQSRHGNRARARIVVDRIGRRR
jgi:hypothetical protein